MSFEPQVFWRKKRMLARDVERDAAAARVADQMHGAEIERVDELGELVDVVLPAELVLDARFDGRPVMAEARRDAAVVGRQRRELRIPVAVVAQRAVHEHHWRAAAPLDIRQADA